MATPSRMQGDYEFAGDVYFGGTLSVPAGTIDNAAVDASAAIAHTKTQHRIPVGLRTDTASAVANTSEIVHIAYRSATVLSAECVVDSAADGNYAVSVDVLKSTGAGAFASILSAPGTINSSTAAKTVASLTLSGTPTLADGDLLKVTATVSGSSGNQAKGLCVAVTLAEDPQ